MVKRQNMTHELDGGKCFEFANIYMGNKQNVL